MAATGDDLARRNDGACRLDATTEIRGIDPASEDHLVDGAQMRHREGWRQELECDVSVLHLVAQPLEGVVQDLVVVERELGR